MEWDVFVWRMMIGINITCTLVMIWFIARHITFLHKEFKRLKTDHFDIQVTMTKLLDGMEERNKLLQQYRDHK